VGYFEFSSYVCERISRAWHFDTMRPVVVLFAKQRNQVLPEILRVSIQPKTTFHKTGRRGLDCCVTLDILAEVFKVAHYRVYLLRRPDSPIIYNN